MIRCKKQQRMEKRLLLLLSNTEEDTDETPEVVYPYPTYEGEELQKLLSSDKWTNKEEQL